MTLLRNGITALVSKINTARPPTTPFFGNISPSFYGSPMSILAQLQQPATSPWIFAVVSRIARSVAEANWVLRQTLPSGEVRDIPETHPAMTLWREWNPFLTDDEAMETIEQHLCIVGEAWILKVRNGAGIPVELWPIRPDRMTPIPDAAKYLAGYRYQVGNTRIDLAVDDVIFIRRPSPVDPFRGMGPLGSLTLDVEGERAATQYMTSFFRNNAEPGGILKFDEGLSDADFERVVSRWNAQHRGVENAHRVAVIERGEWVERKYTQRDMQFEQLRRFNRDLILGAFGMPRSVMGITEEVNRSNAEAGMFLFAHWVVKPELERIRSAVNDRLIRAYGPPGLHLDFLDSVPVDKVQNLAESVEGYKAGILTRNEARLRLGEAAVEGGEEFAPPPIASPFGASYLPAGGREKIRIRVASPQGEVGERQEGHMGGAWRKRLTAEMEGLLSLFTQTHSEKALGFEQNIVESWDWDWWTKYGEAVVSELEEAFMSVAVATSKSIDPGILQMRAAQWAEARAARLLRLDGDWNLAAETREWVRGLVAETIQNGESLQELAKRLREGDGFSRARAIRIARTETGVALGQGRRMLAMEQGQDEKRWVSQKDDLVRPEHIENESAGWISIADVFPSGQDTIGDGPAALVVNCRCNVIYRHKPVSDVDATSGLEGDVAEAIEQSRGFRHVQTDFPLENRCPQCHKLIERNKPVQERYCARCKTEVVC